MPLLDFLLVYKLSSIHCQPQKKIRYTFDSSQVEKMKTWREKKRFFWNFSIVFHILMQDYTQNKNIWLKESKVTPFTPSVNFINILHTNFSYERQFGSFSLVTCLVTFCFAKNSYEKWARIILMKLTPGVPVMFEGGILGPWMNFPYN